MAEEEDDVIVPRPVSPSPPAAVTMRILPFPLEQQTMPQCLFIIREVLVDHVVPRRAIDRCLATVSTLPCQPLNKEE